MHGQKITLSVRGKQILIPTIEVCGIQVLSLGKVFRTGWIFDEIWLNSESMPEPEEVIAEIRSFRSCPDLFTFAQRFPDVTPHYPYCFEWENLSVVSTESYQSWFETEVARSVRKDIRKAQKERIDTRVTAFDDELIKGISSIYNESKIRQDRPFWHYGKSLEEVKRENGTYLERSFFVGAYFADELVGFIKIVLDGNIARMMQILSKTSYWSKRPTNALISKTVEECASRGMKYLTYGEHTPGRKEASSLISFKERNGFRKIEFPRYYVPLTTKGRLALKLSLYNYKGWRDLVPASVVKTLIGIRSRYYAWHSPNSRKTDQSGHDSDE